MTKTVRILANVPMRVNLNPEHELEGTDLENITLIDENGAPIIAGGEDSCGAIECCFVQLPVTLVLEVKVKADCRVKDIICGKPADC